MILPCITVLTLLTACGAKVSDRRLEVYCPPLETYDTEFNEKLADEVQSLPSEATAIPEALIDYVELRDRVRRCEETRETL